MRPRANSNADVDAGSDENPAVATNGAGVWIAAWATTDDLEDTIGTDGDILYSRSTDNGATWSDVAILHSNADTDSGVDAMPRLVNDGALNWIASWQSTDTLGSSVGTDNDIFYVRSDDDGVTWTGVATLNSNAATDIGLDTNATIGTDNAGNWIAVWETNDPFNNTVGTDYDVFAARSTNNGQSWTTMALLNSNATNDTGNDCAPCVEFGGGGEWVAVWHSNDTLGNTVGSDNDIFVAASSDNGATWSAVKALDPNAGADTVSDVSATVRSDKAGNWLRSGTDCIHSRAVITTCSLRLHRTVAQAGAELPCSMKARNRMSATTSTRAPKPMALAIGPSSGNPPTHFLAQSVPITTFSYPLAMQFRWTA